MQISEYARSMKPRLLLLLGAVLLLHWGALNWLSDQIRGPAPFAQLAEPMFIRIVEQTKPPEPLAAKLTPPPTVARPKPQKKATPTAATVSALNAAVAVAVASPPAPPAPPSIVPPESKPPSIEPVPSAAPDLPTTKPSAPTEPPTDTWPPDTRLTYRLTGNYRGELTGSARVQWQQLPAPAAADQTRRYQVRLEMSLSSVVVVSMTSQGQLTDDALLPEVYEEKLPGIVRRVAFDGTQIRFNNGRVDVRPTTVQDTTSQFVELSHRFATGRDALIAGAEIRLWLARPGGLDFWTYDVIGPEVLQTHGLGAVEAFHLKPRPLANPRGPIVAEMWFAPSLQFLPVRVRIALGGDNFVDLMVERIEQADTAPALAPARTQTPEPT